MLHELQELNSELKKLLETADEQTKNLYADQYGPQGGSIVGREELQEVLKAMSSVARNIDEDIGGLRESLLEIAKIVRTPPGAPS